MKMNKEIEKAMNRKEPKEKKFRKWWNKNGYKVARVVLFPIWLAVLAGRKFVTYLDEQNPWDEKRADEILSYYLPRVMSWNSEGKTFYFFDNGYGWGSKYRRKYIKFKDRRFWRNFSGFWGGKTRDYLIKNFELEGFEKIVGDCLDSRTELKFVMKEEG